MWLRSMMRVIVPLSIASFPGPLFLIWLVFHHQLSLSPDSASYISAAKSLNEGTLISYDGSPYVYWPPMLPWLLALLSSSGISVITAAAIINASSWFGLAFISGAWVCSVMDNTILACATALWVSVSAAVLSVALYVWSEVLFSFFVVFSLWALCKHLTGRSGYALLLAGLSCGSAALTRYIGVVLYGMELLALSLFALLQRRLLFLISFSVVAGLPPIAWILRNIIIAGSPTGIRYAGDQGLKETIYSTAYEVGSWFIPQRLADLNAVVGIGLFIVQTAAIAFSVQSVLRNQRSPLYISILVTGTVSTAYLATIIAASVLTNSCCVGGRFEAPIFPILILAAIFSTYLIIGIAVRYTSNSKLMRNIALLLFVLLGVSVSFSRSISNGYDFLSKGPRGYSQARYLDPNWINFAKKLPRDAAIFSNLPAAVYLGAGRRAAYTPRRGAYASSTKFDERPAFARLVATGRKVFILWFKDDRLSMLYDLKELQNVVRLRPLADFADVTVYEPSPRRRNLTIQHRIVMPPKESLHRFPK